MEELIIVSLLVSLNLAVCWLYVKCTPRTDPALVIIGSYMLHKK